MNNNNINFDLKEKALIKELSIKSGISIDNIFNSKITEDEKDILTAHAANIADSTNIDVLKYICKKIYKANNESIVSNNNTTTLSNDKLNTEINNPDETLINKIPDQSKIVCLFIYGKDKNFKDRIKEMDFVQDDVGYYINEKHRALLDLSGIEYIEYPVKHKTFEDFKIEKEKIQMEFLELEIEILKQSLKLNNIDIYQSINDKLISVLKQTNNGKRFLKLINIYKYMKQKIEISEIINSSVNLNIQFIKDRPINFLTEDAPEMPKLVNIIDKNSNTKALIRRGIVAELVGAGGVGKTHFLAQLALSIATGSKFLGICPIEQPGNVLLVLGENTDEDIHRLLRKTYKGLFGEIVCSDKILKAKERLATLSVSGIDASFINRDGTSSIFFNSILKDLQEKEPADGWSLIILDPASRFLGSDAENDNAAATKFIALLERLTLELKGTPTVLFSHHMNKSSLFSEDTDQTAGRGSSALTDGVRLQINLERVKDDTKKIKMKVVKSNHTEIPEAKTLEKDSFGCLNVFDESQNTNKSTQVTEIKTNNSPQRNYLGVVSVTK